MLYYVSIGEREVRVEIDGDHVSVDGRPITADLQRQDHDGLCHLLLDHQGHTFTARRLDADGRWELRTSDRAFEAQVMDERTRTLRSLSGAAGHSHGPRPVHAPMPGLIVRVEVAAGDAVTAGQGVVVIEAMKMENELRAQADARVARVHVQPGQAVEKGAVLVEFEAVT